MRSEVEHAHAWNFQVNTTRRLLVLGVLAILAVVGLQSVAFAAIRSPGRGNGNPQGGTTKSSLAHRHGDAGSYVETAIVSDQPGVAPVTDPNLDAPAGSSAPSQSARTDCGAWPSATA